ncbi:MAG: IS1595 family transposase [Flavobacteriaceae bacterium]|nr:IS1595 family transposase [Flavobacteriaceae bacterium]
MGNLAKIMSGISQLNFEDLFLLREQVSLETAKQKKEIYAKLSEQVKLCPHCGSENFIKWGTYSEMNRFMCKECHHTFIPTTGTAIHWSKKPDELINFSTVMFSEGLSTLKHQSKRVGVSQTTAFHWRHRILIALGSETPVFKNATEMDDIWLRYSQKGRKGLKYSRKRGRSSHKGDNNFQAKVLITKEREGELDVSLIKIGRLSEKDLSDKFSGKFTETAILYSDMHPSIRAFSKSENIKHEVFKAKTHAKNKLCHVQTVNYLAGAFKDTVNKSLRGVSTKYLQNYANWFALKEKYKKNKDAVKNMITGCLSNIKAWDMSTNIEKMYEQFLLNHSVRTYRCPTQKRWKYQNWNSENAKSGIYI